MLVDPIIAAVVYYVMVGFVMNLTGILITAQEHRVRVKWLWALLMVFLWPYTLFQLIKGANE